MARLSFGRLALLALVAPALIVTAPPAQAGVGDLLDASVEFAARTKLVGVVRQAVWVGVGRSVVGLRESTLSRRTESDRRGDTISG